MKKLIYLPIVLGIALFASCENGTGEATDETAVDSVVVIEETTLETPAVTEETLTSEDVVNDTIIKTTTTTTEVK